MGAGIRRWWRDHTQECARWTGTPLGTPYRMVEARTESGIVCRVVLHVLHPMRYGIVKL